MKEKAAKYLKYAVGEIVLVMIGILLALQVNNWNEGKKKQLKINQILRQVNLELEYNINEGEKAIEFYVIKDSLADRMFNRTLKSGELDPIKDREQINIMFNHEIIIPETEAFENLVRNSNDIRLELEPIIRDLKKINITVFKKLIASSEKMKTIANAYRNYLVYNSDWFYSYYNGGQINEDGINHIFNEPIFKNNLTYYRTAMTTNYNRFLRNYVHKARIIHQAINEVLGDTINDDFEYKRLPLKVIQNYEGTYLSDEQDSLIQFDILLKEGTPYIISGNNSTEMFFTDNNNFINITGKKFQILKDGSVLSRTLDNGMYDLRTYKKIDRD